MSGIAQADSGHQPPWSRPAVEGHRCRPFGRGEPRRRGEGLGWRLATQHPGVGEACDDQRRERRLARPDQGAVGLITFEEVCPGQQAGQSGRAGCGAGAGQVAAESEFGSETRRQGTGQGLIDAYPRQGREAALAGAEADGETAVQVRVQRLGDGKAQFRLIAAAAADPAPGRILDQSALFSADRLPGGLGVPGGAAAIPCADPDPGVARWKRRGPPVGGPEGRAPARPGIVGVEPALDPPGSDQNASCHWTRTMSALALPAASPSQLVQPAWILLLCLFRYQFTPSSSWVPLAP